MKKKSNNTFIVVIVVVLVLLLFGGFGMAGFGSGMMGGYYTFSWLINLVVLIALILFIIWSYNQIKSGGEK